MVFQPTSKPIVEIASAVYRVDNSKIVEYWMQKDLELHCLEVYISEESQSTAELEKDFDIQKTCLRS